VIWLNFTYPWLDIHHQPFMQAVLEKRTKRPGCAFSSQSGQKWALPYVNSAKPAKNERLKTRYI
jgi:hypothetical protein